MRIHLDPDAYVELREGSVSIVADGEVVREIGTSGEVTPDPPCLRDEAHELCIRRSLRCPVRLDGEVVCLRRRLRRRPFVLPWIVRVPLPKLQESLNLATFDVMSKVNSNSEDCLFRELLTFLGFGLPEVGRGDLPCQYVALRQLVSYYRLVDEDMGNALRALRSLRMALSEEERLTLGGLSWAECVEKLEDIARSPLGVIPAFGCGHYRLGLKLAERTRSYHLLHAVLIEGLRLMPSPSGVTLSTKILRAIPWMIVRVYAWGRWRYLILFNSAGVHYVVSTVNVHTNAPRLVLDAEYVEVGKWGIRVEGGKTVYVFALSREAPLPKSGVIKTMDWELKGHVPKFVAERPEDFGFLSVYCRGQC